MVLSKNYAAFNFGAFCKDNTGQLVEIQQNGGNFTCRSEQSSPEFGFIIDIQP
jgi:hypothetical protein